MRGEVVRVQIARGGWKDQGEDKGLGTNKDSAPCSQKLRIASAKLSSTLPNKGNDYCLRWSSNLLHLKLLSAKLAKERLARLLLSPALISDLPTDSPSTTDRWAYLKPAKNCGAKRSDRMERGESGERRERESARDRKSSRRVRRAGSW